MKSKFYIEILNTSSTKIKYAALIILGVLAIVFTQTTLLNSSGVSYFASFKEVNNRIGPDSNNMSWVEYLADKIKGMYAGEKLDLHGKNTTTRGPKIRYVTLCSSCFNSRKSGNQMFNLVGLLYVQKHTGRIPLLAVTVPYGWLESIIDHRVFLVKKLKPEYCPCHIIKEASNYDSVFANLSHPYYDQYTTIEICGYMQAWRYVEAVKHELFTHLNFRQNIEKSTQEFLHSHARSLKRLYNYSAGVAEFKIKYIGLHNRRGDFVWAPGGFTVATDVYIKNAIQYYVDIRGQNIKNSTRLTGVKKATDKNAKLDEKVRLISYIEENLDYHIVLVVCSDDLAWTKAVINKQKLNTIPGVSILYSEKNAAAFDLRLLTLCNDSIITVGTFSWWSGYLAGDELQEVNGELMSY